MGGWGGGAQAKLGKGKKNTTEQMMGSIMEDGSVSLEEFTALMKVSHDSRRLAA